VKRPKLSIVIPAYNEAAYLPGALDSIASQTLPADEVIVVDNNSTDATAKLAASYPFVKVIREKTQGIAPARDRGFNEATGDLIGRIDSDTRLPSNWVRLVHKYCDKHVEEILAVTGSANIYDMPGPMGRIVPYFIIDLAYFHGSRLMLGHSALYGSNMVITKHAWDKVKAEVCTDGSVHEDVDLGAHVSKYGRVVYDNRLQVAVSKRGFIGESPAKVWWRLKAWQKSAHHHQAGPATEAS
jgi:glycosyltransferase involved in cell wall biosynthesis